MMECTCSGYPPYCEVCAADDLPDWDEPIIKCSYCDAPGHYGFECPRAAQDEAEDR